MHRLTITLLVGLFLAGCGTSTPREESSAERITSAMKISDPIRGTSELVKNADAQQKAGEVLDVRSTLLTAAESARSIPAPASKASGMTSVAMAFARTGDMETARPLLA